MGIQSCFVFVAGCIALIKESSYYNRTMNSKLCLVFLFVAVSTCYGQLSLSSTGAFSRRECPSANEQCLLDLCRKEDPGKFECQALSCKVDSFGQGISKKQNTLNCVRQLCRSSSHSVCSESVIVINKTLDQQENPSLSFASLNCSQAIS